MSWRVAYPKAEWDRASAWHHLHGQLIPGCPKICYPATPELPELWVHGWRKAHTKTEWAWVYPRGVSR